MIEWIAALAASIFIIAAGEWWRRLIVKNALFYARKNIIIVGLTFGLIASIKVILVSEYIQPLETRSISSIYFIIGLISILRFGFPIDPIDTANKGKQTIKVAATVYLISTLSLIMLLGN